MSIAWHWPAVALASFVLTWATIQVAAKCRMIDLPNERSSHDRPVPRGGGVAIVLAFVAGMAVAIASGAADGSLLVFVLVGGGLVAVTGLADDRWGVSVGWRLLWHAVAAVWTVSWIGGIPAELLPGVPASMTNVLGVLGIVWLINLYNFMDGIDGLASIEALTVCLGGIGLYLYGTEGSAALMYPAMLMASVAGLLAWNFPPARVFLGDVGSGFLGFMMALFCIQAAQISPGLFWGWIILLGVFIVDSGVTLGRRMWRRQRLSEAHRSHAYQRAARRLGGHAPVSLAVGAINLVWLLPMALLVAQGRLPASAGLPIAYAPLIWLAVHFRAGAAESPDT